jgi:hypothetical protein
MVQATAEPGVACDVYPGPGLASLVGSSVSGGTGR